MKPPTSTLARVLAAALRSWAHATRGAGRTATRLEVRATPDWDHTGTVNLTHGQTQRLVTFMRDDLDTHLPAPTDDTAAERLLDTHLDDLAAAGQHRIRPADLLDIAHRAGRPKAWAAEQVDRLEQAGRISSRRWRPGVYRIHPPAPVWAVRPGMPNAR